MSFTSVPDFTFIPSARKPHWPAPVDAWSEVALRSDGNDAFTAPYCGEEVAAVPESM
ncbi:hypothetical protein [Rathayibacter oskolensis]|uniref:hypothetical protein n=1 Tax=Rathayibacter oskolensis TaxID=1891671 RepID=UPI00346660F7